jgi:uncharacterized protein (DUF885 family)
MKIIQILVVFLLLASCQKTEKTYTTEEIAAESKKANDWFDAKFDEGVDRSPMYQTFLGIKKDYDKWDDITDAYAIQGDSINKADIAELKSSINYDKLDSQTKLSYDLWLQQTQDQIDQFQFRFHNYPLHQMRGLHSNIPSFLINFHRVSTEQDLKDYIARLNVMPLFEDLKANLKTREEMGILPPKFVFEHIIRDCNNIASGTTILDDFKKKLDAVELEASSKKQLLAEAEKAFKTNFRPAYEQLGAFLVEQEKKANTDDGVWKFPNGAEFYNIALKNTTTTNLTADKIHNIGLKEVERIHGEMREIMKQVKFEGDLAEFFNFMRFDKQFYYPETEAGKQRYLDEATALIETMKKQLDGLFIIKPKADIIVKRVEPFREKSAGKAFYNRPSADGSRPGIYYANLYKMSSMPTYQMEALAYHEGIPGHHMQLAVAQELEGIPKFRKFGGYTAYTEGWGLYSELIPKELGFYSDPYSDFGRLAMELWRACRLVVDTGIHSKKWDRARGIKYYMDNTPNPEDDAIKMVERHIVMAGQATAYKIGMIKILELRENAKKALGDKFDIREYHEVVIKQGPLPLSVLETNVNNWVASKL